MTASKSMPRPVAEGDANSRILEKSELIDRLATEMRAKSGGELPLSFCIHQVKRQLSGELSDSSASDDRTDLTQKPPVGAVFHAWAMRD